MSVIVQMSSCGVCSYCNETKKKVSHTGDREENTNLWWSRITANHVQVNCAQDVCDSCVIVVVIVLQGATEVPTNVLLR